MKNGHYKIAKMIPLAKDYLALNLSVGWQKVPHKSSIDKALRNSLLCLCALHDDKVVGFVRVVGDKSICFYIQDLIVLPDHQRRGIGTKLMNSVMQFINAHAASVAFVGLMAAVDAEPFYQKFGFSRRPNHRPGMDLMVKKSGI